MACERLKSGKELKVSTPQMYPKIALTLGEFENE